MELFFYTYSRKIEGSFPHEVIFYVKIKDRLLINEVILMKKKFKTFDFLLFFPPILLAGFGIVMIYSASMVTASMSEGTPYHFLIRQGMWFVISLIAFIFTCFFNYRLYQKLTKMIIIALFLGLLAVEFFGITRNNATSWLAIGPFSVQPSEFVKIGIIIYLASVYTKKQQYISDFFRGVLPPLIIVSILLGLIMKQPDIGTAAIIFAIACSIIFSSGVKFRHLSLLITIGLVLLVFLVSTMSTDVRISRFTGAYQPFEDPEDSGYQIIQLYIAIATGGLEGQGLGQGVQKLGYLTQAESDFIIGTVAEELGVFGVAFVIGMMALIVLRGLYIAKKCPDLFGSLLAIGISCMVAIQAIVNLGATSGLLPITGVPLPFVSYGGTSLLVLMLSMGILNNIARHVRYQEFKSDREEIPENDRRQKLTVVKKSKSYAR